MQQARCAMRHAFGKSAASEFPSLLPTGVYTIPEAAMVGETEETLKREGLPYLVGRAPYDANPRGKIVGDSDGMLKMLVRREDLKLLGVHVLGEQATELVHVGLMAMLCNSDVRLFDEACFNIPTLGQLYKVAALDALRQV
jgi:NAD(P) transhydrogenase